ncbi:hypothetical protein BDN72DRAFT_810477 [Pluteus cervinus]|uniref:Uncharacterized protein n=1 Tax=Pluteus cervinus TaxID=181527 RepID=A0ACD3BDB8_9AGAR|nr:hypothetical protein BDN72DRAFT_810477 [Pluteus cervinus]
MVMANKWVLNVTTAPIFFIWTQLIIASILFLISDALRILPSRLTFDLKVCKGLIPNIVLNVTSLILSNYTLKNVDASFYQVARGLVLPFTVLTSGILLRTRPSLLILLACTVVTIGFFVGVFLDAVPVSSKGIFLGVASSFIAALHSAVIKISLDTVKSTTKDDNHAALALSWYTNLLSAVVLIPIFLLAGEGPGIVKLAFNLEELITPEGAPSHLETFLWGSFITGILGFLMSIASLLSIQVTSPITHMISSAVRGVAASLLGMWFFKEVITIGRASSIAIILAGSIWYTWIKNQETQRSKQSKGEYERVQMEDMEAANDEERKE